MIEAVRTQIGSSESGFTLVETLVALAVFSMLAMAGAFVLGNSAEAAQGVERASAQLHALQRTRAAMSADIGQMVDRPSRDSNGDPRPALAAGEGAGGALMAFVRMGPDNPDGAARPAMQYVAWAETPEGLVRRAATHLDGGEMREAVLWPGAQQVAVAFNYEGAWSDAPIEGRIPAAIRVAATTSRYGPVEQIFLTGAAT